MQRCRLAAGGVAVGKVGQLVRVMRLRCRAVIDIGYILWMSVMVATYYTNNNLLAVDTLVGCRADSLRSLIAEPRRSSTNHLS